MDAILEAYKEEYGFDICVKFTESEEGDIYRFASNYAYTHPHAKTGIPTLVLYDGKSLRELDPHEIMFVLAKLNRKKK